METILIADDHEIVRQAVRMMVDTLQGHYKILEAATCSEAITILSEQKVSFAILDMSYADGNIFSSDQQLSDYCKKTAILIYSMNDERIYGKRLLQKGVRGFVSKQASVHELKVAIDNLLKGEVYLSPWLKESFCMPEKTSQAKHPIEALSDRELEVAEYIMTGMGTKEIAWKMNLDITTISTYRRRAFEKLDVQNVIQLKDKFLFYKAHH